jgi:hypothetical protein
MALLATVAVKPPMKAMVRTLRTLRMTKVNVF